MAYIYVSGFRPDDSQDNPTKQRSLPNVTFTLLSKVYIYDHNLQLNKFTSNKKRRHLSHATLVLLLFAVTVY